MTVRVEALTDDEVRASAVEWVACCVDFAANLDPLSKPIRRPSVHEPGYAEIQDFRKRLGFITTY
jgi:hypothetical protein